MAWFYGEDFACEEGAVREDARRAWPEKTRGTRRFDGGDKLSTAFAEKMMQDCRCDTLEQCGKGIFRSGCADVAVKPLPSKPRRSP